MAGPSPSSPSVRGTLGASATHEPIDAATATATFLIAWVAAQFASFAVLSALGAAGEPIGSISISTLAAGLATTWTVYIMSMVVVSQRAGSGSISNDFGLCFRTVDLAGLGIGALSQLVAVNLVYVLLRALWPDAFSDERVQETARDLVDRAAGSEVLLLVLMVVVGAPLVEELFYRGLLQGSLVTRFNEIAVVILVAVVFAAIHFRPVEFPGLLAFGLILGVCALKTGRLGMAIAAHVGFNATGLVLAS